MSKKALSLQEFVKDSLTQIIKGIHDAQKSVKKDAIINPVTLSETSASMKGSSFAALADDRHGNKLASIVDFDMAVTVADAKSVSGKIEGNAKGLIGVVAASVGLGIDGERDAANSSVSRIKFRIPVRFPAQKVGDEK